MAFKIQKRGRDEKRWTDVGESESLDKALELALATEKHAHASQADEFDVYARVVDGKRVIWS